MYHLVQVGHHGIVPLYYQEGFNPKCPSRTIVPFGTGGTSQDNPIVLKCPSCTIEPFGTGGTSRIIPLYQQVGFNPKCPSCTMVPFGTGGTAGITHCTNQRGSIPSVHPVPLYHLVQVGHPGIIPLYHQEWLKPKCPSHTIVPFGTGGTSRDNPIVPTSRV